VTEGLEVDEHVSAPEELAEDAWVEVTTVAEIRRSRKMLVQVGSHKVALFWHDGDVFALQNSCIHKQRHLVKGTMLGSRVICPGHQWAFEIDTGYEQSQDACQPTFPARIEDERVLVQNKKRVLVQDTTWTPSSLNR
jgi:nitrite reductase (NADH) small subunit